jgi:hypothetical protein
MSKSTRMVIVCLVSLTASALIVACATGGQTSNGDDQPIDAAVVRQDANTNVTVDAPVIRLDAGITLDAFVPLDAPGSGLFCTADSQCTKSGECCIDFGGPQGFCGPGVVVLGECIPQ